jgi:hypothetical protein
MKLQRVYLDTSVLGGSFDPEFLVSWNFKHIVRFDKIRLFNAVNLEYGYKPLQIFSPREVTTYGRAED